MFANYLGYRENLGAKSVGILDLDPRAVAQYDDSEGRSLPVPLFDEEEVGPELKPMPVAYLLR